MLKLFTKSEDANAAGDALTPDVSDITERIVGMRVMPVNPSNVDMLGNAGDSADEDWITMEGNMAFDFPLDPLPQFKSTSGGAETIKFVYFLKQY